MIAKRKNEKLNPINWAIALAISMTFAAVSYQISTTCKENSIEILNKLKVNFGECKTSQSGRIFTPYTSDSLSLEQKDLIEKVRLVVGRASQAALRAREAEQQGFSEATRARSSPSDISLVRRRDSGGASELYEGQWINDAPNGFGMMTWMGATASIGEVYSGQFVNGRRAMGVFSYPPIAANTSEVKRYEGEWASTARNLRGNWNGVGVVQYRDGSTYRGELIDGERQGFGAFTNTLGERTEGVWQHDQAKKPYKIGWSKDGALVEVH